MRLMATHPTATHSMATHRVVTDSIAVDLVVVVVAHPIALISLVVKDLEPMYPVVQVGLAPVIPQLAMASQALEVKGQVSRLVATASLMDHQEQDLGIMNPVVVDLRVALVARSLVMEALALQGQVGTALASLETLTAILAKSLALGTVRLGLKEKTLAAREVMNQT